MKERPILFNASMVRAILEGRKTQTRRIVKPSIVEAIEFMGGCEDHEDGIHPFVGLAYGKYKNDAGKEMPPEWAVYCTEYPEEGVIPIGQLYGAVGDQLWVRETCHAEELDSGLDGVRYLADGAFRPIENTREASDAWLALRHYGKKSVVAGSNDWRNVPSIHMQRWASRIQLEITGVRVERLNDISEEDALAEGVSPDMDIRWQSGDDTPRGMFGELWESINGSDSWDANPWVWVIEFKVLKGGAA